MPACKIGLIRLDTDIGQPPEVDRDQCCYIRDRKVVARDKPAIGKFTLKPSQSFQGILPANSRVVRALPNAPLEELMLQAKGISDRPYQDKFHSPLPHLDYCAILGPG